jgi:hypothetical protein
MGNQLTRPCAVTSGVREGDALSATLLNLALHKVIKKLKLMVLWELPHSLQLFPLQDRSPQLITEVAIGRLSYMSQPITAPSP